MMNYPSDLRFWGDMRVVRYDRQEGLVMARVHESVAKLVIGLFFSVGLAVVGVALFLRTAVIHYRAGAFSFVDALFVAVGAAFLVFGFVVAVPLFMRLLPRRLHTRHDAPAVALKGMLRTRIWRKGEAKLLRIYGRGFVRQTTPETKSAFYTCTLEIVAARDGWETRLMQTIPQPESDVAYGDMYPLGRYFADLLECPLEYRDTWETREPIPAPRPD